MATRKTAATASTSPAKRTAQRKKSAAEVLAAQRRDIANARDLCRTLVAELNFATEESDAIEEFIAQVPETDKRRQTAMLKAITLAGRAAVMRDLATATRTLIELERRAFDLSAADESDAASTQPSAVDSIAARIARLATPEAPSVEA